MPHVVPAPIAMAVLCVFMAVRADWRDGYILLFLFGLAAGWRPWSLRATLLSAAGYVVLGVVAAALRVRGVTGAVLGPALSCLFLAFLGHFVGAAFGAAVAKARDAALSGGKAAALQIGRMFSGPSASSATKPVSDFPSLRRAGAPGETVARARAVASVPKGWKPTVSPRRRGWFG